MIDIDAHIAILRRLQSLPPIGYRLDTPNKRFVSDAESFPIVRRIFEAALGGMQVQELLRVVNEEWGFRTPQHGKLGGGPLGRRTLYRLLTNPFYAGIIVDRGQAYRGHHEPVVTSEEFVALQAKLRRPWRWLSKPESARESSG